MRDESYDTTPEGAIARPTFLLLYGYNLATEAPQHRQWTHTEYLSRLTLPDLSQHLQWTHTEYLSRLTLPDL